MDNRTKRHLKEQDQFVNLTEHGLSWAQNNRQKALLGGLAALIVVLAVVGGITWFQQRSNAAEAALGAALQTYQTPVSNSAQPLPPGMKSFPSATERAKAAHDQFAQVAQQYGLTHAGHLAEYFVGVTAMDENQPGAAEEALKKTASSWDSGLAALGKMALAGVYRQTGEDAQAATLYQELGKGNSTTVPASLAQIQLAEMYQAQGKTEAARAIYGELKDKDKDAKGKPGAAAQIATAKLNPQAAAGPALQ